MRDKYAYDQQYIKDHIKMRSIPFNTGKQEDMELMDWLAKQSNATQYIKRLIREDMERSNSMKKSEVIVANRDAIRESMIDAYGHVIDSRGRMQYQIYVWEDGEIERLSGPQGDNSYLKPRDMETRKLFYICTVSEPLYDPRDQITDPLPDDDAAREAMLEEVDAWMKESYSEHIDDVLDSLIEDAEREEMYE